MAGSLRLKVFEDTKTLQQKVSEQRLEAELRNFLTQKHFWQNVIVRVRESCPSSIKIDQKSISARRRQVFIRIILALMFMRGYTERVYDEVKAGFYHVPRVISIA